MTSISALSANSYQQSPLQRLQDELQSEVNSGAVSSTDQSALSSALTDIDSSLQADRASDQSSGTRPSPGDLKSKIDDLIQNEVSSGNLTSDQATELAGRVQGRLRPRSGRQRWSWRARWSRRRRWSASRSAAVGWFVLERRHGQFVQRQFGGRSPAAIPAIAAELALVFELLQRDGNEQHHKQQQLLALGDSHRLSELIGSRRARFSLGATILRQAKDGCSVFRCDGSVFPLHRKSEIAHANGNGARVKRFSPYQFSDQEESYVIQISRRRHCRFDAACQRRIRC